VEQLIERSPSAGSWSPKSIFTYIQPPLWLNQYVFLADKGKIIAWCSWAFLNEETEARLLARLWPLTLEDWHCGERCWIIDLIAPFGGMRRIYRKLETFFADNFQVECVRWLRTTNQGVPQRLGTWRPLSFRLKDR
jgi:hemolysin-activating ACP:hemolysin acyltransferase